MKTIAISFPSLIRMLTMAVCAFVFMMSMMTFAQHANAQSAGPSFSAGDSVETAEDKTRVRPSLYGWATAALPVGTEGTVIGGPSTYRGLTWYQVQYETGDTGWTANYLLREVDGVSVGAASAASTDSASSAVSEDSSSNQTVTRTTRSGLSGMSRSGLISVLQRMLAQRAAQQSSANTSADEEVSTDRVFSVGDEVEATEDRVRARQTPGSFFGASFLAAGTTGTVVSGPQNFGRYTWYQVEYNNGVTGWTAQDFLMKTAIEDPVEEVVVPEELPEPIPEPTTAGGTVGAVELTSSSAQVDNNVGYFQLEFEVTAEDDDISIPNRADRATQASQDFVATNEHVGVWYSIYNAADPGSHAGTFSAAIDSTADEVGENYEVREGTTETFTLEVTYDPNQTGEYRITLEAIVTEAGQVTELTPAWNYRTNLLNIDMEVASEGPVVFEMDYESGNIKPSGSGITVTAPDVAAARIDSSVVRAGNYAIRYELEDTDPTIDGGTRSESHLVKCSECRYEAGDTDYYGFSVYIPANWEDDGVYSDILFQWHAPADYALGESSKNPNMFLARKRDDFVLRITSDDNQVSSADSVTKDQDTLVDAVEAGWHDFVFKVDWSYEDDGRVMVWHKLGSEPNYDQVLNRSGANMHNDESPGFLKWGIYKPSWNGDNTTAVSSRVVYFDDVKVGTTFEAVEADPELVESILAPIDVYASLNPYDVVAEPGMQDVGLGTIKITADQKFSIDAVTIEVSDLIEGDTRDLDIDYDSFSLWVAGDKVAETDASDAFGSVVRLVPDGGIKLSASLTKEIIVAASLERAAMVGEWKLRVSEISGEALESGDEVDVPGPEAITFQVVGKEYELAILSSEDDPNSTTFALEKDDSIEHTVFAFDLEASDEEDITVDLIKVAFNISNTKDGVDMQELAEDFVLYVDGDEIPSDFDIDNNLVIFDTNSDLTIAGGDRVTVEVGVEFAPLASQNEGATIQVSVDENNVEAEVDALGELNVVGSASGATHTLRTQGALIDYSYQYVTNQDNDQLGVYRMDIDVTAFDQDVYIDSTAIASAFEGVSKSGFHFVVRDNNGVTAEKAAFSTNVRSMADMDGVYYVVPEGETEQFTIMVAFQTGVTGFYRMELVAINYSDEPQIATDNLVADRDFNAREYWTKYLYVLESDVTEEIVSLVVAESNDDPNATTFELDRSEASDFYNVFSFDLDASDSEEDVQLQDIELDVTLMEVKDGIEAEDIIDDAKLIIDGEEYTRSIYVNQGRTIAFPDIDHFIANGDTVTAELYLSFAPAGTSNGAVVQVSTQRVFVQEPVEFDAEGEATGDQHTLLFAGPVVDLVDTDTNILEDNTGVQTSFTFDITAFGDDIYVNQDARRSNELIGDEGFNLALWNLANPTVSDGAFTTDVDSTAEQIGEYYRVREGQTEEFTVFADFTPEADGTYFISLDHINFNTESAPADQRVLAGFDSDSVFLYGTPTDDPTPMPTVELDLLSSLGAQVENSATTNTDDAAQFAVRVYVTAKDADVYLSDALAIMSQTVDDDVLRFYVKRDGDVVGATAFEDITTAISTNADQDGDYYVIPEGETEFFVLRVTLDPNTEGSYKIGLASPFVYLNESNGVFEMSINESAFESNTVFVAHEDSDDSYDTEFQALLDIEEARFLEEEALLREVRSLGVDVAREEMWHAYAATYLGYAQSYFSPSPYPNHEQNLNTARILISYVTRLLEQKLAAYNPEPVPSVSVAFLDSSTTLLENDDATTADDEGQFDITFEVTAVEDDLFINRFPELLTVTSEYEDALRFVILKDGVKLKSTEMEDYAVTLESTGDRVGNYFQVSEGETEEFTLTVVIDPSATGNYTVGLSSPFSYSDSSAGGNVYEIVFNAADFKTASRNIQNDVPYDPYRTFLKMNINGQKEYTTAPALQQAAVVWTSRNVEDCTLTKQYRDDVVVQDATEAAWLMEDLIKPAPLYGLRSATISCTKANIGGAIDSSASIVYTDTSRSYELLVDGQVTDSGSVSLEIALGNCLEAGTDTHANQAVSCTWGGQTVYQNARASDGASAGNVLGVQVDNTAALIQAALMVLISRL